MSKFNWLKKASSLTLASALAFSLASCQGGNTNSVDNLNDDVTALAKAKRDGQKKWTVMVHLAADNNLYPFGLEDINEMEAGLKGVNKDDINVVVLFDGEAKGDSAVYEIKADPAGMNKDIISPKVDNPVAPAGSEIDSGDKVLAGKFLSWASDKYPADHYAYIVWNHGAGWQREGKAKNGQIIKPIKNAKPYTTAGEIITKEFAWDDNGSHMSTVDLNGILDPVAKKLGRKIDILDFDACLMAHTEVAYQMRNSVDFLVASEKTEPGAGNPYHDFFGAFAKNPSMGGQDFASMMVKEYGKSYTGGSQGNSQVTLSATSTSKLVSDLVPAINSFGGVLASADKTALVDLRSKTENYENADCKDIGHFAKLVSEDARLSNEVKDSAKNVLSALKSTVVENFSSSRLKATGLVMYFPNKGQSVNSRYAKLDYAEQKWDEFLQTFVK